MSKNVLVTLADENYIEQAKQLFSSVYHNSGWKGDYLLLSYDISEKDLKWFREKGILVKKIDSELNEIGNNWTHKLWTSTILAKFLLFTSYFKKWKRVIFLDGDIYVRGSLDELLEVEYLGACNDQGTSLKGQIFARKKDPKIYDYLKKKYDLKSEAFNVGVLVIETKIIKKNTFEELIKLYKKTSNIVRYPEQAVFNFYFYKKLKFLHKNQYNYWPNTSLIKSLFHKDQKKLVSVLHFVNSGRHSKPWDKKNWFYSTWKKSLKAGEEINLDVRKKPKNRGTVVNLFNLMILLLYKKWFKIHHQNAGRIGKIMRKLSPRLYLFLGGNGNG